MPEQIIPNQVADFAGGVNLRDAPIGLAPGDLILSENIEPIAGGWIRGRGGQTEYNASQIDANPIRSLYRFYKTNGTKITLATSGTKVYKGDDGAGTFTDVDTGYTSGKKFSFVTWATKDKVYWINDAEVLKSYDGTTAASVGGSPPVGSMVELHDDRLWILRKTLVNFSGLNVDDSWPGANALNLVDRYGGEGKFIKSFGRGLLIIAKDSGLYRFEGSPGLGGKLVRYSDVGCVAPWTADVITSQKGTPDSIVFLAMDGMYATNGFECWPVSGKLDTLFTLPSSSPFRGAVGKYYQKKRQYFLSFNTAGGANNDLYCATLLDAPNGQRISWNRYTGFQAESFMVWNGPGDDGQLFYGRSDLGKIMRADNSAKDVGANYLCQFQTPWYDGGSPLVSKMVRWLYLTFESLAPITFEVGYSFGAQSTSGQAEPNAAQVATWGPGSVTWGPGSVVWSPKAPTTMVKESVIFLQAEQYFSFKFKNSGDGPNFKFFSLGYETKVKPRRHFQPFAVGQM